MMRLLATSALAVIVSAACSGPASLGPDGSQPAGGQPTTVTSAPQGSGGVRIALTLGGGPHQGEYNLPHTNPCRFDNPSDGAWALTATFPNATSEPSIVDLVLLEGSSFVDAWYGDDRLHAEDVDFTVDDRGETATLTATGEASGPDGGQSFPVEITVECDRVARY